MRIWLLAFALALAAHAAEADALAISANIQAKHRPFGTILDPIYAAADSSQIVGYTRCGDSAIWTGHYLAAEAFRYNVTQSPDALANVESALAGLKSLVDATGTNLLARCVVPRNSSYAAGISSEEASNGIYSTSDGQSFWVGNTSRDQYAGVFFGLGVAYDLVNDSAIQSSISQLASRMLDFLIGEAWTVAMPNGTISTTFLLRPDELLALLQVGQHVNPARYATIYSNESKGPAILSVSFDALSDDSYFKFNLDYICFYNLIRLENSPAKATYQDAYAVARLATAGDQNAFFDSIDRALNGPSQARDYETLNLLNEWLLRPRRDPYVDTINTVAVCGGQSCDPVPVPLRPPTDFLWQRNPYQLSGGGSGVIESAGIDYILPYWMSRYNGVSPAFVVQSAAAASAAVAPDSLGSIYGLGLASEIAQTGVGVLVQDSFGTTRAAALLYVSPRQINFVVPSGLAAGGAMVTISNGASKLRAPTVVWPTEPTLFDAGTQTGDFLTLYGTGIRGRNSLGDVQVTVNGENAPVLYAGPQPQFAGLDQVNVALASSRPPYSVVLKIGGQASNSATISPQ